MPAKIARTCFYLDLSVSIPAMIRLISMMPPQLHHKETDENKPMEIAGADFMNGRELIVNFSDGTSTVYSVEQLMEIRPTRSISVRHGLFCEDVVKKITKELAEWERDKSVAYTLASTVSNTLRSLLLTSVTELAIPNPAWENLRILRL